MILYEGTVLIVHCFIVKDWGLLRYLFSYNQHDQGALRKTLKYLDRFCLILELPELN